MLLNNKKTFALQEKIIRVVGGARAVFHVEVCLIHKRLYIFHANIYLPY
jgi:hypothetical protein